MSYGDPEDDELDAQSEDERPRIGRPFENDKTPPLTLRGVNPPVDPNPQPVNDIPPSIPKPNPSPAPSPLASRRQRDEQRLSDAQDSGSGISRLPTAARIPLRILEGIGSAIAPGTASLIPGTELHHNAQLRGIRGNINQDVAQESSQATAHHAEAEANALENPQPKPDEAKTITTDQGVMQWNPATQRYDIKAGGAPEKAAKNPIIHETDQGIFMVDPDTREATPLTFQGKPLMPKSAQKPDSLQQQYDSAVTSGDTARAAQIKKEMSDLAQAGQTPQRDPQQFIIGPDGVAQVLRPGMKVEQGSKTVSGDLAGGKPTADEQRRADLATNVNENLDQLEDIVNRRPELFGPLGGRLTSAKKFIGSNDPDVSALSAIEHNLGMAVQGAHAMRSAQGVAATGDSLLNGFKNGPAAILGASKSMRDSLKTFANDVQNAKNPPQAGGGGKGPLSVDEARTYLQKAGGDKDKARALAKADGRTF